jgi:PAS domain S-box-containing protein
VSVDRKQLDELRKQTESQQAENKWLSAVLNAMTEEVYFTDTQRRYTYANPAAMREFGNERIDGVRVEDVVVGIEVFRPDGTPRPLEDAPPLRALRGEIIREEEQLVRTPRTGELRHRQVNAAPVRNAAGEIIGSVAVVRDITERKRFEQTLEADLRDTSLLRDLALRVVTEDDPKSVFEEILDAAIAMVSAQAGTIQLLDALRGELTLAVTRGFPEAMTQRFARVDAYSTSSCGVALASGRRAYIRFDLPATQDPDGDLRVHLDVGLKSALSTPLISRSGRVLGMFTTHWNTVRQLGERELRFVDLLARQAADLIERMQNDQALRQREQALRESDRRKDEFIAMLAHELRNPLVPIRNGIELLKRARQNAEVVDSVRPMMERQIGHMVRLIDDLLDVARIAAGKIELRRERVALSNVVSAAVDAQKSAIDAARLHLDIDLPGEEVPLDADSTRLSQVLSNLLHNATKFTPAGGRIAISARRSGDDGKTLRLVVRDTGMGIAPDQLPRIFDLFVQSGVRVHPHPGGLGIGLAIARRLIELHGGGIEARSAGVGHGSEFIILLPMAGAGRPVPVTPIAAGDDLRSLRILVVDDNHDAADSMAMLVEQSGARVRVAYSAREALGIVGEFMPQVVLLDIGMPGMDGYEACRRLRALHGDDLTIVAVSGWGQESDKQLAQRAGFDAHLTKPADPQVLAATIAARRKPGS